MKAPLATLALSVALVAAGCSSESAADAIRRGDALYQKQQFLAAADAYRVAIKAEPRNGTAHLKRGDALMAAGDWGHGSGEIIEAAELMPDNADVQMRALWEMLGQQRFEDLLERLEPKLKAQPNDPRLYVLFGNATARLHNSWNALETFDRTVRSEPNYRLPEGLLAPRPASADRKAEEAFRHALDLDPKEAGAATSLANLLWAMGRMDDGAPFLKRAADANPGDVLINRCLGLYYQLRDKPADAEKYLKVAATSGERNSRLALADFLARQNRNAEALALFEQLAAGDDPQSGAAVRAADIELRQGRPDRALQRAEQVLAREPRNPGALRVKAQVLLSKKEFAEAVKAAQAATDGAPPSALTRSVLAQCLMASGDLERAFQEFSEAWRLDTTNAEIAAQLTALALSLDRPQVAAAFARRALQLKPADSEVSVLLIRALVRSRDFAGAEQALASVAAAEATSSELLVLRAATQAGQGNRDAARTTYQRVLATNRESLDALAGLVILELQDRLIVPAKQRVDQALARHRNDSGYMLLAVRVAVAEGDAARAESVLRKIMEIDPASVEAAILLSDVLAGQNRHVEAKQAVEKALTHRPSSVTLQAALAGIVEDMGQIPDARGRYEAIVAANPGAFAVSARLARLYANQGDNLDVALNYAQAAKQGSPKDPSVDDTLGWVYVRKALPTLGRPHLESAVRADPNRALYRYHLGVAYERLGEVLKAREQLNRALALDPNFAGAADARALLKTLPK